MAFFANAPTPQQLVLHGSMRKPDVTVVPNPSGASPRDFERNNEWIPRLGTDALLSIAAEAIDQGWQLNGFELADSRDDNLNDDQERADASEQLGKILESQGLDRARVALRDDYPSTMISGVRLLAPDNGSVIVRRDGVVIIRPSSTEELTGLLSSIWAKARLG